MKNGCSLPEKAINTRIIVEIVAEAGTIMMILHPTKMKKSFLSP